MEQRCLRRDTFKKSIYFDNTIDVREELAYCAFYPTMQGAGQKRTPQTGTTQADGEHFMIQRDHLHFAPMLLLDVRTDLFDQRTHPLLVTGIDHPEPPSYQ